MNFEEFTLSKETMKSIAEIGFEEPTPIQVSAIPLVLSNRDIVGQAQTGTGKTAAFGIPIAERFQTGRRPFAIVLEPTRELAVQVAQEIHKIGKYKNIRVLPVYGGASIEMQIKTLQQGVNVVVGTPGRVIDLLNRKILSLSEIRIVVLDEADEMLDMGFIEDIETILKATPEERQTLLFSATIPLPIMNIARRYMRSPEKIQVNIKDVVIPKIRQTFYEVREEDKVHALSRILDVEEPKLAIVFCHTKRKVDEVSMKLSRLGYNAGAIHGDYTQARRDDVMNKFKGGMLDILVATDVAARGLDIKNVSHVINYGIPQHPDSYVHRIGRTGRAGKSGIAITLVTPREYKHLRLIEKTARTIIDRKKLPSSSDVVRAREKNIVRDISEIIRGNQHAEYLQTVKELSNDYAFGDIAAAALCAAYGEIKKKLIKENHINNESFPSFISTDRKDKIKSDARPVASKAYFPFHRNQNKNRYRTNNIVKNCTPSKRQGIYLREDL
jgi:ATP-dependent RNA helicase DeaD